MVTGGTVQAPIYRGTVISVGVYSNVTVSGGTVKATEGFNVGIGVSGYSTLKITGGRVEATGANSWALNVNGRSAAAYLEDTCAGTNPATAYNNSMLVEIDSLDILAERDGTTEGITIKANDNTVGSNSVKWDCSGNKAVLMFELGTGDAHEIEWSDLEGSAHVHDYATAVTAPTCTEQGYTTYTCECGNSYVGNYVPTAGHDGRKAHDFCDEDSVCEVCGENLDDATSCTPVKAHGYCDEDALCTVCGQNFGGATVHDFGEWITVTEPQIGVPGLKERLCAVCDKLDSEIIPALPGEPVTPPSNNFFARIIAFFQAIWNWIINLFS